MLATNSFTWLNQNLRTHTDPRGFTRTFTFDKITKFALNGLRQKTSGWT